MCQNPLCQYTSEAVHELRVAGTKMVRLVCADRSCTFWASGELCKDVPNAVIERDELHPVDAGGVHIYDDF
ncbi:hypothetical protein ACWT_5865 [Actinoplanes sp. SE50]|nr:hypothetical protein ACPL_5996 [Actinoplanes sp. SE50/110]ATO85280.1 hypothetical protein ACWT_5865 [Actinoplanes sp. SE50]SLM02690.1 hypothetical protein ACSP50_5972 [Actinoplanes sp. SE50/110]